MPLAITLARSFTRMLQWNNREALPINLGVLLQPDCKTQVTLAMDIHSNKPQFVQRVVISTCHTISIPSVEELKIGIMKMIEQWKELDPYRYLFTKETIWDINPSGLWNIGGPIADTGLLGRKCVVDAYGQDCEIGGGAFSGKSPSLLDRTGAYMTRYIAKNIVAHGFADKAKVFLASTCRCLAPQVPRRNSG